MCERRPGSLPAWRPLAIAFAWAICAPAVAQVVLDGTLGRGGAIAGPNFAITADLGRQSGANLFHSFSRFDIAAGQIATFSGPGNVANIIARVTGGTPSSIDGLIRSTIPGADLFLFNPSGIAFGPNATLDLGGAFHVSTAQQLRLADGARFDAANPAASTFSSAPPEAFGFLGGQGAITVSGSRLRTPAGSALTLSAGRIAVANGALLYAPGGNVGLAAVAGAGEAALGPQGIAGVTGPRGDITISAGVASDSSRGSPAGSVRIFGGKIVVEDPAVVSAINASPGAGGSILLDATDSVVVSGTLNGDVYGDGPSGGISIAAPSVVLEGEGTVSASSVSAGAAGPIDIRVRDLTIRDEARIISVAFRSGDAGSIHVQADRNVSLEDRGAISASSQGSGAGGDISVRADTLTLGLQASIGSTAFHTGHGGSVTIDVGDLALDGGFITANSSIIGSGDAGDLTVRATRGIRIHGNIAGLSATTDEGRGGNILVVTPSLVMESGGHIHTFTSGTGHAGNIELHVGDLLLRDHANISASSGVDASGDGGNIAIAADRSVVIDGNVLGGIDANALGTGNGGSISISAPVLEVRGGSISVSTQGPGRGGSIAIDADSVALTQQGEILAYTSGSGRGGSLTVNAREVLIASGARILASAADTGDGGEMAVRATQSVRIVGDDDQGASQTGIFGFALASGNAGSILVSAPEVVIDASGMISAGTFDAGRGASVRIEAGELSLTRLGFIDVSSNAAGAAGNLTIDATRSVTISGNDGEHASGLFARAFGSGPGGTITVTAPQVTIDGALVTTTSGGDGRGGSIAIEANHLTIANGGVVSAAALGRGAAGNITVTTRESFVATGDGATGLSGLSTQTAQSDGGDIRIDASGLVHLQGGAITTSVAGGAGNGGNITIARPEYVVLDESAIRANAYGGNGGNIRIDSAYFVSTPDSVVEASSALGVSGVVAISAPIVDIGSGLGVLPPVRLDTARLLREACATRAGEGENSFVAVGRGGMPESAWSPLASPFTDLLFPAPRPGRSAASPQSSAGPCAALRR